MTPDAVAVVVPVHDEADLLDRCLAALTTALDHTRQTHPGVRIAPIIVLDACTDASEVIARSWPVRTLRIDARCVGTARHAGVAEALDQLGDVPPARTWIATTDGDSVVPLNWLSHQLDLHAAGAEVVLGTVRPDFADLTAQHAAHWIATHHPGNPAGNVHGANLGLSGEVYVAAGGFADLDEHEDVELVRGARAVGARVAATDRNEVVTSGRFDGRTPGGYAAFVRATHARLSDRHDVTGAGAGTIAAPQHE